MSLASHFLKRFNGDITGVGKAPFRKRFSKYRQARKERKRSFFAAKKMQDRTVKTIPKRVKGIPKKVKNTIHPKNNTTYM